MTKAPILDTPSAPPPAPTTGAEGGDGVLGDRERAEALTLLATVFVVGACGLIYELLIATISSYLLGSSVTQFSLCIGAFIGSMGIGSYASQFVGQRALLRWFIVVEVALAGLGGLSAWVLFGAYALLGGAYHLVLYLLLGLIGGLVGLELPLLTRLLNRYGGLRTIIAQALSFDYVGSLLGSVAFPLLLLPTLGTTRTAFLVGFLNLGVAVWNIRVFRPRLREAAVPYSLCGLLGLTLALGFVFAEKGTSFLERRLYEDEIIYARQTPYQRIVLTRFKDDLRLFLDGNLQFSSTDEYRYHEALVHPALGLSRSVENVLILGGGDGLGVREALKHRGVRQVTLVDIDPAMTDLARTYPSLVHQNGNALADKRVRIVHDDAYKFLERSGGLYDVIIADLPDPNNEALAKLYAREFYRLCRRRLGRGGVLVTQATSPFFSRDAFWCVDETLKSAGFATTPYHLYVPSFGDWGFILCAAEGPAPRLASARTGGIPTRYLSSASLSTLTVFDNDTRAVSVDASTLDYPRILTYYESGAKRWE